MTFLDCIFGRWSCSRSGFGFANSSINSSSIDFSEGAERHLSCAIVLTH